MALNEAYGQTDLAHEPNRLRRMLQSPNPRDRETAQLMLDQLNQEHTKQLQQQDFYFRQNQSAQDSADRDQTRRDIQHENLAARKDNQNARQEGLKEAHDTGRAQQLQMMAADPNLGKATQEAAKLELNRIMGLNVPAAAPGGAKGEYGPGGAPKGSTPTPPTTSYNAPTDAFKVDQATGVGSGSASPVEMRDYQANHSSVDVTGLRTTTFPSGGIAKAFDRTTPQGREKIGAPHELATSRNLGVGVGSNQLSPSVPSGQQSKGFEPIPFESPSTAFTRGNPPSPVATAGVTKAPPASISGVNPTLAKAALYTTPIYGQAFAAADLADAFLGGKPNQPSATPTPAVAGGPQPNPTPEGSPAQGPFTATSEAFQNAKPAPSAPPSNTPPAIPLVNPQASNDRQDLLKDTENTFYGGGHNTNTPAPTPTPTPPNPQRLAEANTTQPHPMTPQALAYLRLLGLA